MALLGTSRYVGGCGIGFVAGFTLGCCGWGGAQIIKPSLTSTFMGVSQLGATGASLTSLSGAATVGAARFYADNQVDIYKALSIAVPSMLGVRVGIKVAQRLSNELQSLIFNGMSVLLIPSHFFIQKYARQGSLETSAAHEGGTLTQHEIVKINKDDFDYVLLVKNCAFGCFLGALTSIMGVGGVPMVMSYLTVSTDCPHHLIQGTAMAACLPPVLASAVTLGFSGHTPLPLAASVAVGSMIGSYSGAQFALSLSDSQLRQVYMASLVLLGGRSLFASLGNISKLLNIRP